MYRLTCRMGMEMGWKW